MAAAGSASRRPTIPPAGRYFISRLSTTASRYETATHTSRHIGDSLQSESIPSSPLLDRMVSIFSTDALRYSSSSFTPLLLTRPAPPPPADPHPAARHVGDESLEVELYATNRFTLMSADRPSFYSKLFLNRFDTRLALRLTSVEAVDRIGKGPACINVTARFEAKRKKKTCSKKRQQTRFL
jgi:hypothetical protein